MKLLQGKVAIITGGSRGIGEAIAKRYAEHGASVAFTYRSSEERAKQIETELKAMGVKARGYKSDASSYEQAETLVKEILEEFGQHVWQKIQTICLICTTILRTSSFYLCFSLRTIIMC